MNKLGDHIIISIRKSVHEALNHHEVVTTYTPLYLTRYDSTSSLYNRGVHYTPYNTSKQLDAVYTDMVRVTNKLPFSHLAANTVWYDTTNEKTLWHDATNE